MRTGSSPWDVIVVGSGPAGATAARNLARQDLRVLILEGQRWPRYKTCGGGLVWRARHQLDVEIEDSVDGETRIAELHEHDVGATFSVTRDLPLVTMALRSKLDDALTQAAVRAGAEMRSTCKVTHVDRQVDHLAVTAADQVFRTRYLVAADGAAGATASLTGWPPHRRLIPALESEIRVDRGTLERFSDTARFDFGLIPAGYAWVFPKRDTLSVGCLSWNRHQHDLKSRLTAYLQRLEIRPEAQEDHGFVIPVAPRSPRLVADRVLLTGDSAGLADPVTCEGISNAIHSGRLAAEAIAVRQPSPETVALTYQGSLEASLLRELRYARLLARFLFERPVWRRLAFRRLGQSLAESMAEIICGDLTYQELLTRPSHYLRAISGLLWRSDTYPKG